MASFLFIVFFKGGSTSSSGISKSMMEITAEYEPVAPPLLVYTVNS